MLPSVCGLLDALRMRITIPFLPCSACLPMALGVRSVHLSHLVRMCFAIRLQASTVANTALCLEAIPAIAAIEGPMTLDLFTARTPFPTTRTVIRDMFNCCVFSHRHLGPARSPALRIIHCISRPLALPTRNVQAVRCALIVIKSFVTLDLLAIGASLTAASATLMYMIYHDGHATPRLPSAALRQSPILDTRSGRECISCPTAQRSVRSCGRVHRPVSYTESFPASRQGRRKQIAPPA
jgi:hypothetical protein